MSSAAKTGPWLNKGVDSANYRGNRDLPVNVQAAGNWHLHVGTVQLFIVGDARNAWLACSVPQYARGEKVGTDEERAIAQRAVEILKHRHNFNPLAGAKEISEALEEAKNPPETFRELSDFMSALPPTDPRRSNLINIRP